MKKNIFFIVIFFFMFISCFSQEYTVVGMSLKGNGMEMERNFPGKIELKENYISMDTPMGASEGTTFLNKEGLISFQSDNLLQTLKVVQENGTFLKSTYNTKIIIYCIDILGGLTTTLYCNKN
ncbi:hypothetical protein [Flavobacterium sp.]|uniref:hypothetical protein n=1 Tax=Flavobacterium sp. TaxID=239 RepID=UPI0040482EAD